MKYIKEYNSSYLNVNNMSVVEIVKEIGYKNTEKYLNELLKGKYTTFKGSVVAKTELPNRLNNSGTVERIFYISSSGFIISRLCDDGITVDLIINRSIIECHEELDYENALLVLDTEKYNL